MRPGCWTMFDWQCTHKHKNTDIYVLYTFPVDLNGGKKNLYSSSSINSSCFHPFVHIVMACAEERQNKGTQLQVKCYWSETWTKHLCWNNAMCLTSLHGIDLCKYGCTFPVKLNCIYTHQALNLSTPLINMSAAKY